MTSDAARVIARAEAETAIDPDEPLDVRFRAAFTTTYRHWAATDADDQWRAAIEAVYVTATEPEQERILVEVRSLRDLAALLDGVPIAFDAITAPDDPIGILKIWRDIVGDTT